MTNDPNAAFHTRGFLTDLSNWRDEARRAYEPGFKFIDNVNELAMQVMWGLERDMLPPHRIAAIAFYAKALKAFQCAVLLLERGAVGESRALLRLCAETVIVNAALLSENSKFLDQLLGNESNRQEQIIEAVYKHMAEQGYKVNVDEVEQKKAEVKEAYGKPQGVNYFLLAKNNGLDELYILAYRGPSGDAAHATLEASARHMKYNEENEQLLFNFNPSDDGLGDSILVAGYSIICLLELATEKMGAVFFKDKVAVNRSFWNFLCRMRKNAQSLEDQPRNLSFNVMSHIT